MIVDDRHQFIFIHIPKCAGTTIRLALKKYDSSKGKFAHANGFVEGVGKIDMGHIPLKRLHEFFPEDFQKIKNYRCFAVVRDPYKRFSSSVYQHLKMYSGMPVRSMRRSDFVAAVDDFIGNLDKFGSFLPYDYIHFQRQRDYIYYDDKKLVENLYTSEELENMFSKLSQITGEPIELQGQEGEGLIYKGAITGAIASSLSIFYSPVVKGVLSKKLLLKLKALLMEKPSKAFEDVFSSNEVKDFIGEYYREDIVIYQEVEQGSGKKYE